MRLGHLYELSASRLEIRIPASIHALIHAYCIPAMEPFRLSPDIVRHVGNTYSCPRISTERLRAIARGIVEARGGEADFDIPAYREAVSAAILATSLQDIAQPGTGLRHRINQPKMHTRLPGPMVLEIVHLTDIGVSPYTLERVRQDRERRVYLDRVAHTPTPEGQDLLDMEWMRPALVNYPRRRLKLFLSDGFVELQAIEIETLPGIDLGDTPMGTKIRLVNVPISGGVAYLRPENVTVLGGSVLRLQKQHKFRFFEELDRRMEEDDAEAEDSAEEASQGKCYMPCDSTTFLQQSSSRSSGCTPAEHPRTIVPPAHSKSGQVPSLNGEPLAQRSPSVLRTSLLMAQRLYRMPQHLSAPIHNDFQNASLRIEIKIDCSGLGDLQESDDRDSEMTAWHHLTPEQERIAALVDGAVEFGTSFMRSLDLPTFDPRHPLPATPLPEGDVFSAMTCNADVIHALGYDVGPGVTRAQFHHVMRRCIRCNHVCFQERQEEHRCPGRLRRVWKGGQDALVAYLFSREPNTGLSGLDLRRQFVSCGLCGNICTVRRLALHQCPDYRS
ncbi:hypothetical protein NMY22_g9559 [Coprinellus aureogranulatus]|nr:hypothetical protein NMY22_g9559 [Coprinellus aureogranulatus]